MLSEGIRKCKNSVLFSGSKEVSLTLGWNVLTVIRFKKNKFKDFCYFFRAFASYEEDTWVDKEAEEDTDKH